MRTSTRVNIVNCMCIFVIKKMIKTPFYDRHKARLVCDETFSSVVKLTTIRTVLGLIMARKCSIHQLNVKTAFFMGDVQETIVPTTT